jgi:polyferredoxin
VNPSDGALIAAAGALLLLALVGVLGVEWYLLAHQRPPITSYTRMAVLRWPGAALTTMAVIVFIAGTLVSHFGWDAGCG